MLISLLSSSPIFGVFFAELAKVVQEGLALWIYNLNLLLLLNAWLRAAVHRLFTNPEAFLCLALAQFFLFQLVLDCSLFFLQCPLFILKDYPLSFFDIVYLGTIFSTTAGHGSSVLNYKAFDFLNEKEKSNAWVSKINVQRLYLDLH